MLLECFEKLRDLRAVKALRSFFGSWAYLVVIVAAMVLSNTLSLEIYVYYFYLLMGLLIVLFEDDLRGIIPIIPCCYMSVSMPNNPAASETGIFRSELFCFQLIFILLTAVVLLVGRLISLRVGAERKKAPLLALGFAALGLSYLLGGLFSPYYGFRTALFGFVQILSLCALYFLFYYGVEWKEVGKDDWAKIFTAIGLGILAEVLYMYATTDIISTGDRNLLDTGWGIYNNVGCAMAICLPAPLYLAATRRNGWLWYACSLVLAVGLALTQSRGAILFGGLVYAVGVVLMLIASGKKARISHFIVTGVVLAAAVVLVCIPAVREHILGIYRGMSSQDFFNSSGRWEIYENGLKQFRSAPFFGVGFYQCTAFRWPGTPAPEAFFPARYHDTYVQLLASGGIFALCCYLLHRIETLFLLFRRPAWEKTFIALCIGALLAASIVDCHFFNIGPGLSYGILLAFAEGAEKRAEKVPSELPEKVS